MKSMRDLVSKKQWFALFNLICLFAMSVSGRLTSGAASLAGNLIALAVVNVIIAISTKRNHPDWK